MICFSRVSATFFKAFFPRVSAIFFLVFFFALSQEKPGISALELATRDGELKRCDPAGGQVGREEIPGFAWLIAKNKPQKNFALTREKQQKTTKSTKTPPQKQKNTKKNTKKTPFFFLRLRAKKKAEKKVFLRLRAKKSFPWLIADEPKRMDLFPASRR